VASTRHYWLQALEALSPAVAALNLTAQVSDEQYWDTASNCAINADAFNLSGCPHHNAAIARWIGGLAANGVTQSQLTKLLVDLTSRNTYGTFSEISGYGLLLDSHLPFQIQVPMGKAGILNPNGADLDGRLTISGDVLFDIKAFGLHEHLSNRLRERLSGEFSSQFVAIEGSADVAVSVMTDLLGRGYASLVSELRAKGLAQRDGLDVILRPIRQVQVTSGILDPYALAKNHAEYAIGFAKQFARRKPFMLSSSILGSAACGSIPTFPAMPIPSCVVSPAEPSCSFCETKRRYLEFPGHLLLDCFPGLCSLTLGSRQMRNALIGYF
jgi:hypothetical protein